MDTRRPRTKKTRNVRAIRALADELTDVLEGWEFSDLGIVPSPDSNERKPISLGVADSVEHLTQEEDSSVEEDYEDPDEEEYGGDPYADVEDIQMAVDEAISAIIKKGVIPDFNDVDHAPTLSETISKLCGKESELASSAEYFEELIDGYEGRALIEDLREAGHILALIVKGLKQRVHNEHSE